MLNLASAVETDEAQALPKEDNRYKQYNHLNKKSMRLIIQPDYDKMSQWAAEHVIKRINEFQPTKERPFVLGLPTGSSPVGMYRALVKAYQEGRVSFKNVLTFLKNHYKIILVLWRTSFYYI